MGFEYEKLKKVEADGLRRSAFFGIAISTVATLTAIVAVPMLYNYVQHVQSSLEGELEFCKYRTDGLWNEYRIVFYSIFLKSFKKICIILKHFNLVVVVIEEASGLQGRLKREARYPNSRMYRRTVRERTASSS
ncbi:unnamed protein product, partial [Onchocerca flexuosa]|uniref:Col_cuticle_N domain-containing protein n=1 Tax=Onchocerca flexuosa TaxID=387005 RepID=A0A183GZ62_9BILA